MRSRSARISPAPTLASISASSAATEPLGDPADLGTRHDHNAVAIAHHQVAGIDRDLAERKRQAD